MGAPQEDLRGPPARPPGWLEWVYRYGFTLLAAVVLLGLVLYYTHVLDVRSYDNALQLQQMNDRLDTMSDQLQRIEARVARQGQGR